MLKEKNSAGGGKFKFFNLSKEKDNELAESVNVKEFISYLKDKIINENSSFIIAYFSGYRKEGENRRRKTNYWQEGIFIIKV